MNYDKHLTIRISQEQLDWLDSCSDYCEASTSEIIRSLIEEKMKYEVGMDKEYEKLEFSQMTKDQQIEAYDRGEENE